MEKHIEHTAEEAQNPLESLQEEVFVSVEDLAAMDIDTILRNVEFTWTDIELFGNSIEYWISQIEFSEEEQKLLANLEMKMLVEIQSQIQQYESFLDIAQIWLGATDDYLAWLYFTSFRSIDDVLENNVAEVRLKLSDLSQYIWWEPEMLDQKISEIFTLMRKTELDTIAPNWQGDESERVDFFKETKGWIIWVNDIWKVQALFFDESVAPEQRKIGILQSMRYEWLNWNSQWAKAVLVKELLWKDSNSDIQTLLHSQELVEVLEDADFEKLALLINSPDIAKEIQKNYNSIHKSAKESYLEFKKENPENTTWKEEYIDSVCANSCKHLLSQLLIQERIMWLENRWDEDSYEWLYANIIGLWETAKWDFLTLSDSNIQASIEFGTMIAVSTLTMWSGIVAVSATSAVGRGIGMWTKLASYGKTWAMSAKLGWAVVEGTAFYQWMNLANNLIYRDLKNDFQGNWKDYLSHEAGNAEEITKSIFFLWAYKAIQKMQIWQSFENLATRVPDKIINAQSINLLLKTTNLPIVAGGFYLTEWMLLELTWEGWKPTMEEYLTFVALIWVFKLWMDKIQSPKYWQI